MGLNTNDTIAQGDFIDSGDLDPTPSNDNAKVPKLETVDSVERQIARDFFAAAKITTFSSSGTYTKPTGLKFLIVEMWAGGGGGHTDAGGSGGGGGAYTRKMIDVADIGTTETVTIGAGGAKGVDGGNTSFGSHATAYGGAKGSDTSAGGGGGGSEIEKGTSSTSGGTGGAIGGGDADTNASTEHAGAGGSTGTGGGKAIYGAGGGGAGNSVYGGAGGADSTAGSVPGGGGGKNAVGADGEMRVYEFF